MRYVLAIVVCTVFASNAFCEDTVFEGSNYTISMGLGIMDGHTTYRIGGNYVVYDVEGEIIGDGETIFPLSELEFPLDVYYGSLYAKINPTENLEVAVGLKKNISENAGKMQDTDWGYLCDVLDWWTDPDSLDVYSVSDTETDALVLDISARFYFNPLQFHKSDLLFFFGGKYVYQKFKFTANNYDLWYPSLNDYFGFDIGHDYFSGKVMTYEISKNIPAVIAGAKLVTGPNLILDVMFGYSPDVTIKDEDHHLLRNPIIISKSKCDGEAFLFAFTCDYRFSTRWSLGMKYDYTFIDTDGIEKQDHVGEFTSIIEQKNFSDLHAYEMSLSYRF